MANDKKNNKCEINLKISYFNNEKKAEGFKLVPENNNKISDLILFSKGSNKINLKKVIEELIDYSIEKNKAITLNLNENNDFKILSNAESETVKEIIEFISTEIEEIFKHWNKVKNEYNVFTSSIDEKIKNIKSTYKK